MPGEQRDSPEAGRSHRTGWQGLGNGDHMYKSSSFGVQQPELANVVWRISQSAAVHTEGHTGRALKDVVPQELSSVGGYHPLRRSLGILSAQQKAVFSSVHQNRCGNPDEAPTKACSRPGLRLQGLPDPFNGNGWQQSEQICVMWPGGWSF